MPLSHLKAITNNRLVRKERTLVLPGEVYVKVGDEVTPETVIAKTELDVGQPLKVQVAAFFNMNPEDIDEVLSVQVGDFVEQGEELASYKKNILTKRRSLESPYAGLVEHISYSRGEILIRERFRQEDAVVTVDVASQLGISPLFLKTFLHVREGSEVSYNEVLASVDGMVLDAVRSPTRGTVEKVDSRAGTLTIRKPYSPVYVYGYIYGKVVEVIPNRGAIVETPACNVDGVFGVGNETFGELVVLTKSPQEVITQDLITAEHADKILVGGAGITYEAMCKAQDVHVRGVIVGGIRNYDVVRLVGKEISVGITGQEDMDFAVVATEGFGQVPMLDKTFNLLKLNEGKQASMNGTTQIRAGVIRPEIIVPLSDVESTAEDNNEVESLVEPEIGMKVRVLTEPYYGKWGTVISDKTEQTMLPTGVSMETVRVRLDNGEEVDLIENNLMVYEVE